MAAGRNRIGVRATYAYVTLSSLAVATSLGILLVAFGCARRPQLGGVATQTPVVVSTIPANVSTDVAINQPITATFSQSMDPTTLSASTFLLRQGSVEVPGVVTSTEMIAILTPTIRLAPNATFTATLTTGSKDAAGVALATDYAWTFTTGGGGDLPDIAATLPLNDAVNVTRGQPLDVTFNEAMDPATLTPQTFSVRQGTAEVAGVVSYDAASDKATFTPTVPLGPSQSYDAVIAVEAKSAPGRGLSTPYSWSFSTGPAPAALPAGPKTSGH